MSAISESDLERWRHEHALQQDEPCDHCGNKPARILTLDTHPAFIPGASYAGLPGWFACDACLRKPAPELTPETVTRHFSERVAKSWLEDNE